MSRRKQGRPQQRLTLDTVEQENDLLVCGECRTNFPLREITKFIRHKVNKCNKENVENEHESFGGGEGDGDEANTVISTKRTPISAPIAKKESFEGQGINKSPRAQEVDVKNEDSPDPDDVKDAKDRLPLSLKQVADAESNTTYSEPLKFTCETCRKTYNSAWNLLQHAQKEHGMRIYVPSSRDSFTPSHSPRGSTPNSLKHKRYDEFGRELEKGKDDRNDEISGKERIRSDSTEPHRTTSSVGSASSGEGPLSGHPSPHNPFMFPRMPFGDLRHPLSPITAGMGPMGRLPGDLRLDFSADPYHRNPFGLPGFEHRPSAPFHPFDQRPRPGMSLDDFYSQRLRQLASSTSPSPGRKHTHTPQFTQPQNNNSSRGMFSSVTPPGTSNPSSEVEKSCDHPRSLTPPGNQKSCEFCGKMFRFQSNLIVHRRSHTGEKPFKCPICPHACTQQSKLKRHMKTHSKPGGNLPMGPMSNTSEGSHASSSSTPDSSKMADDDEIDDEEEEEEEEEEVEFMGVDNIGVDRDGQKKEGLKDFPKYSGKSELAARLFDQRIEQTITDELIKDTRNVDRQGSLLSEVMERTGLQSIPIYNESLKLAMAEKYEVPLPGDGRPRSSSNTDATSPSSVRSSDLNDRERGVKRDKPSEDSIMSISKMIKREPPSDKTGTPPVSSSPRTNSNPMEQTFFPSLWFPAAGHQDFFSSRFPLPRYNLSEGSQDILPNGIGISTTGDSSQHGSLLSAQSNASTPTTPLPTNGTAPSATARKDKLRNDTCEFCGKVFKNCSNLTVHRRSHTGEKPYKCMLCSYACAQSSKLTRHMKTHGRFGKDVYKCKFCGMPFSVPSTLEKHMRKCVENTNKSSLPDNEDTGSNSDAASASDSQSAPLTTMSMSLPNTPMSLSSSFSGLMPYSLQTSFEKHMSRLAEMEGENSSSNCDRLSVSGTPTSFSLTNTSEKQGNADGGSTGSNSDKMSGSDPSTTSNTVPSFSSSILHNLKMDMRNQDNNSGIGSVTSPSMSFPNSSPLASNLGLLNNLKMEKVDNLPVENASNI